MKKLKYWYTRHLTFLLVPDDGTQLRRVKIPLWTLSVAGGLVVSFLIVLAVFAIDYRGLRQDYRSYLLLQKEARSKSLVIHSYQNKIENMEGRIEELSDLEKKYIESDTETVGAEDDFE